MFYKELMESCSWLKMKCKIALVLGDFNCRLGRDPRRLVFKIVRTGGSDSGVPSETGSVLYIKNFTMLSRVQGKCLLPAVSSDIIIDLRINTVPRNWSPNCHDIFSSCCRFSIQTSPSSPWSWSFHVVAYALEFLPEEMD